MKLWVEQPCEHGQLVQHPLTRLKEDGSRWDKDGGRETWAWCPGGDRHEASSAEIKAAARPHADLEAATKAVVKAWREARPVTASSAWTPGPDLLAKAAVLAALGADDE